MANEASSGSAPFVSEIAREIRIINQKGLHARASARFVQTVDKFNADVTVSRGGEHQESHDRRAADGLAAGQGSTITVKARGPEAKAAIAAIEALCADRFGEEE